MQETAVILERLNRLERLLYGARAVNVGNNRILTKANVLDLIYYVEADDRLIAPRFIMDGIFEADVTSFFMKNVQRDSVCIDVGANFGYYTCMLSKIADCGSVLSIEADPYMFEILRDNVAINWIGSSTAVINKAAADRCGILELYRRSTRSGNTGIIRFSDEELRKYGEKPQVAFSVESITLDSVREGRVDFIKVDVEGAEPLVFRGAKRLIAENHHITVVMEWSPGQIRAAGFDPAAFATELDAQNLQPFRIVADGSVSPSSWAEVRSWDYCNLCLRHKESRLSG